MHSPGSPPATARDRLIIGEGDWVTIFRAQAAGRSILVEAHAGSAALPFDLSMQFWAMRACGLTPPAGLPLLCSSRR